MYFDNFFLDELLSKIKPSEIIKKSTSLKQRKAGEFMGLCPFHKEKTPSFTVSDVKNFYHCFGCGENGTVINFLQKTEGLSFTETVKKLAIYTSTPLPKSFEKYDLQEYENKKTLYDIMELSCDFFQQNLYTKNNFEVKDYLTKRGITKEAVNTFRIGFIANNSDSLCSFLQSKNIKKEQIIELGLGRESSDKKLYDYFRNRIIFPICNYKGQVIAFGGRTINESMPKYLNSPETTLFKKNEILYNEHIASTHSRKNNKLVLVEGYMDVISMYCSSIKSVVAPLGTAITTKQIQRLWYIHRTPIACMDGDSAGRKSMERLANNALPLITPEYSLRFATLPAGSDPDDILKKEGSSYLNNLLDQAEPMSNFLWETELSKYNNNTSPEISAYLEKYFNELNKLIKDPVVKNHYSNFFKQEIWKKFYKYKKNKSTKSASNNLLLSLDSLKKDINSRAGSEEILISLVIHHPNILKDENIYEEFVKIDFSNEDLSTIRQEILDIYEAVGEEITQNSLLEKNSIFKNLIKKYKTPLLLRQESDIDFAIIFWKYYKLMNSKAILKEEFDVHNIVLNEDSQKKAFALLQEIVRIDRCLLDMQESFDKKT